MKGGGGEIFNFYLFKGGEYYDIYLALKYSTTLYFRALANNLYFNIE
jgi:hypothetical protein